MTQQTTKLYQFAANEQSAQFAFSDGTDLTIDLAALSPEVRHQLMVHGLKQKVADGAAIPRDTDTGRSASPADKIAAMRAIAERLVAGEWSAKGTGAGATGGLLFRALRELYPERTEEQLRAFIAGKSDKEQAALRANPRIAEVIARLKTTRAASSVDTDALLDELEG